MPIANSTIRRGSPVVLVALLVILVFILQIAITPKALAATGPNDVVTGLNVGYPTSLNDQNKLFYGTASALWWVFFSDGSGMQCTTSSDGILWATPTLINSTVISGSKFSVWFDDKSSMLYYVATSGGADFHYRYGMLTASGCGSVGWSVANIAVRGTQINVNSPTISAVDPSTIWVSVTENTGSNYFIEAFLCNVTSCSSKHLVTLPHSAYESIILYMSSSLTTSSKAGLLYAADGMSGGSPLKFEYTTDGGGTWNSSAFTSLNIYQGNRMSAYNIGTTIHVAAVEENNPNNIYFFKYALGGSETKESQLVGGASRNVDIASDNSTGLIVVYTDPTSVSYVYSTNDGATWGTPYTLYTGEANIYQSELNINRGPSNSFGLMWSVGAGPYTIRFGDFNPVLVTTTSTSTSTSTTPTTTTSTTTTTTTSTTTTSTSISTSTTPTNTSNTSAGNSTRSTSNTTTTQVSPPGGAPSLADLLSSFDILSSFVAFPISYYSYRFNRILGSSALRTISIGFAILGTGLLTEGLTGFIADATIVDGLLASKLVADAGLVFLMFQLVAYLSFAWGYGIEVFGKAKSESSRISTPDSILPVGILLSAFGEWYDFTLFVYLLMVVLLAFIVFEAILIYTKNRRRSALLVLLGFGLILASHVLMLVSVAALAPIIFYEGTIAQLFGFVLLLWFLVRSGRFGST